MVKDELRKLLNQPYKSDNWKKVTEFVFPNVSYLQKPQDIPFVNEKIESFKQIGNVKLADGKNLAMFEVHVAENINLASNRVELRKLVAPLIDQERNHGVLVIYEQGKDDYRFTFTAKSTEFDENEGDFKNLETDAKRFTYILGKNESCKTAANRFWELSSNKEKATIKDVEQAFSVERLNKEFFEKYKNFYEDFVQHITGKRFEKEKGKWVEKTKGKPIPEHKTVFGGDDKVTRNFVKLLLGRLVFIQFLQKKGWMGVPASNKKWKDGEKDFLAKLFDSCKSKDKFHTNSLYKLFYNAFNTPNRANDIFDLTGSRVPYLNGGLFENEYPNTDKINFPAEYFQQLLDFFGQYNFTIDENDPLDHEVGIDPEMLGHIFENLLEDNKDKGAYYTPKVIVQHMCQESLIQYLKAHLIKDKRWPKNKKDEIRFTEKLEDFVRKKTASSIIDFDQEIAFALRNVKICDPAIGSGAFPMGLLNEIFYCMQVLYDASPDVVGEVWEMQNWQADVVKKNIIQHSIYGVDLEKGAVDIARLRFWLSLIVDEKEPYPLPNLDFKIMQGNSLFESYEGVDLSKIASNKTVLTEVSHDLFGNPTNSQLSITDSEIIETSNIHELIEQYFNAQQPEKKQKLKKEIDDIIHRHIDYNLEFEENRIHIALANVRKKLSFVNLDKKQPKGTYEKNLKIKEILDKELKTKESELKSLQKKRKELHDLQVKAEKPYFLWHLFFKDVFEENGFDIVIGNPPWGSGLDNDLVYLKKLYPDTTTEHTDSFKIFIDAGLRLIKENGCLSMIIPNTLLRQSRLKDVRKLLLQKEVVSVINLGENIFEEVVTPSCIVFCKNSAYNDELTVSYYDISNLNLSKRNVELRNTKKYSKILQSVFLENPEFSFTPPILLHSVPTILLGNFNDFQCKDVGIQCQRNNVGKEKRAKSDLAKKIFLDHKFNAKSIMYWKGRDIDRYKAKKETGRFFRNDYATLVKENETVYLNESVYNSNPKIIFRQTADHIIAVLDEDKRWFDGSAIGLIKSQESNYDILYLLGILNSKYSKWYYHKLVNEEGRVFAQVKLSKAKQIPIRVIDFSEKEQKKLHDSLVELVKRMIELNSDFDSKANELSDSVDKAIDKLVYELYDLKPEQIKVIEEAYQTNELKV